MMANRYNMLLAVLVIHLVALAMDVLHRPWTDVSTLVMALAMALILGRITGRRRDFWIMLLLGSVAPMLNLVVAWGSGLLLLDLVKVGFWILAPAFLALRVFATIYNAEDVSHGEIAGAVSVYLLLGLIFANVFEALFIIDPAAIDFGADFSRQDIGFGDVLYFSFVTLAGLGYGDVAPSYSMARAAAVAESVTGIMYIAILVARFVSMHSAAQLRRKNSADRPG